MCSSDKANVGHRVRISITNKEYQQQIGKVIEIEKTNPRAFTYVIELESGEVLRLPRRGFYIWSKKDEVHLEQCYRGVACRK